MTDVLVVGAGPVGLSLAIQLARHGVGVRIVEARTEPLPYCRAIGVTPRTLEVYEDMGVARPMVDAGLWLAGTRVMVAGAPPRDAVVDLGDLPYAFLGVPQGETERILAAHLNGLGVQVERGSRLVSFTDTGDGVRVALEGPDGAAAVDVRYLVGCDGAHSTVRKGLGIAFEGEAFPMPFSLGDVHLAWPGGDELPRGMALRAMRLRENDAPDMFIAIPLPERGRYRVSMLAPDAPAEDGIAHGIQSERTGPSLADIQAVADRIIPNPPVVSDLRWSSQFRISMRLAARYRVGRVFIAGDAAHIHPPTGGQGMNTGIQDAYNLAWKMALVLKGVAQPGLLDSYEAERRPVAEGVIAQTVEESINLGRPTRPPDRLAHTQITLSYRGSPIVGAPDQGAHASQGAPEAGDRAPDVDGLRRHGVGFPLRLFDLLRGPEHVLVRAVADGDACVALEAEARQLQALGLPLRAIGIAPLGADIPDPFGICLVEDAAGKYAEIYGSARSLVRPDKYISWRGTEPTHIAPFLTERGLVRG